MTATQEGLAVLDYFYHYGYILQFVICVIHSHIREFLNLYEIRLQE